MDISPELAEEIVRLGIDADALEIECEKVLQIDNQKAQASAALIVQEKSRLLRIRQHMLQTKLNNEMRVQND